MREGGGEREREREKQCGEREKQSETEWQDKNALIRGTYPYLNRLSCSSTEPVSVRAED